MIHWFKKHPKHLAAESSALSNDSSYKELFQIRDNLFVSHGYLIVRLSKIYRFPIFIVYPEATPYALPEIYPLKDILTKEQVATLAHCEYVNIHKVIKPFVKFYYEFRHQNSSGKLCIIEWDNLDDGSKFYGIRTILKRVCKWYIGTITNNFVNDSQEVEFSAHFNNIDQELRLLYPEDFLDEEIIEGEAFGVRIFHFPAGIYFVSEKNTYLGSFLVGKNKGIYNNNDNAINKTLGEYGINNSLDLISKKDIIDNLVNEKKIIRSFWFQIKKEPKPFQKLYQLIEIIGDDNYQYGLQRILPYYLDFLKSKPSDFLIAFRFPNRHKVQEFQLFKVLKKKDAKNAVLYGVSDQEVFENLISDYDEVFAIPCDKFSDESFHVRNSGRYNRVKLHNSIVNIIGVGAVGGEIADSMAKAGIQTINLFDFQDIKPNNPIRHIVGIEHVGIYKVHAVSNILHYHNPFVTVYPHIKDILQIDINEFLLDDSISISSIADDNIEGYLNEMAVISNKVIYYVRALRGGKFARIFRVIPGKDACFQCLNLYRNDGDKLFPTIPEDRDLPTLKNECNNPIRPASAADLKLISALASRIVLDEIHNGINADNHWVWSTESVFQYKPFQVHSYFIPVHPDCYYCHHEKHFKVFLPALIEMQMKDLINENPEIETGGVISGFIKEDKSIVITNVSGPGPKSVRDSNRFSKDIEYCQNFLDELYVNSNKQKVYIGEWHSHPSSNNKPSGIDIKNLSEIAIQKEYLTDFPIMIIFSKQGKPSCTIHPAGKRYYHAELEII